VPADAAQWSVHPFSGEVTGGYLWGRRVPAALDVMTFNLRWPGWLTALIAL
jgi:hypothetical protein